MSQANCKRCGTSFKSLKRVHVFCTPHCAQEFKADQYRAEINKLMSEGKIPATRLEASFMGAKFYCTGQPCGNGHIDVRTTSTKNCVVCSRDRHRRDNALKAGKRESQAKPGKVSESVQTSPVWLHILSDWRPVVVARGMV
tara:strand:- start:27 stop:449 length:423 start_codon:yes stop_codon:yes gene_type:complete